MADSFADLELEEERGNETEEEPFDYHAFFDPRLAYDPQAEAELEDYQQPAPVGLPRGFQPVLPPDAYFHPQGFHYMPVPHPYYANNYVPDGPVASLGAPRAEPEVAEPAEDSLLEEDSTVGPDIEPTLAVTINKVWNKGRARSVMKTIVEENPRPGNVEIYREKINREISSTQPKWAKEKDKKRAKKKEDKQI